MKQSRTVGDRLVVPDALRAIAVLAVVFYHVFPAWVPGGFVGVDIFFLISGFIIWLRYGDALADRSASFRAFYVRRIQRLVPAYLVVLIVTTIAAYIVLPPDLLLQYGQSLLAQTVYLQNVAFLVQGDYFVDAIQKPLLHTWSLAIEEQFYLLFPLLIVAFRWSGRRWPWVLLVIGLGSLGLGLVAAQASPRAAFYLLPFRVWEFVAGIGAAHLYRRVGDRLPTASWVYAGGGGVGLIAIAVSIWAFDKASSSPGVQTVLALSGAFVLCLFQHRLGTLPIRLAAAWPVQHIGQISYSWYLWHWPLVSLYVVWAGERFGLAMGMAILIVGYLAAIASYYLVEQPALRTAALKRGRNALLLLTSFVAFAGIVGLLLMTSRGAIGRYPAEDQPYLVAQYDKPGERCPIVDRIKLLGASVCRRNGITAGDGVLLLGDSHSNMIREEFTALGSKAGVPLYVSTNICRPAETGKKLCSNGYWTKLTRDIARYRIRTVLIAAAWPYDFDREDFLFSIGRLQAAGVRVFIMAPIPQGPAFDPTSYIGQPKPFALDGKITWSMATRADYDRIRDRQRSALSSISSEQPSVRIVDPAMTLCPTTRCIFAVDGRPIYSDDSHINADGVRLIRPQLSTVFAP